MSELELEDLPMFLEHEGFIYYRLDIFEDTMECQKATIEALEAENKELRRALAS